MTPEQWHKVKEVFDAALERDSNQRAAFLYEACDGDVALRREVESLIESYEKEENFMSLPAMAAAAISLLNEQAESPVGQMVGHYKILAPIGAGGMGEVYLAQDTHLGRQVALKLLPTYLSGDSDRLQRFEQEARAASSLNHPNVCMIYEVGEMEDGRHYIVMEHIEGVTLRERLAIKPFKLREVLDAAVQVASALGAAHAAGVVHRDIKPENIMLRRDGYLKVLDFGLAKLTEKLTERQRMGIMPLTHPKQPEDNQDRRNRPDFIGLDVLDLARDLYDVVEASPLSAEKRISALQTALFWARPGPKGKSSFCSEYPVTREYLQRLERTR